MLTSYLFSLSFVNVSFVVWLISGVRVPPACLFRCHLDR